jgi:hypothetical protein
MSEVPTFTRLEDWLVYLHNNGEVLKLTHRIDIKNALEVVQATEPQPPSNTPERT